MRIQFVTLALVSSLFLSTCNQPTESGNDGSGIIVPGVGVEGIKLGNLKEVVVAKLGQPTSIGWADGIYRSWRAYFYDEGQRGDQTMRLHFCFIDSGDTYGPLDLILIGPAYGGKTMEGIGIGESLAMVHDAYGPPQQTLLSQGMITDKYCLNGRMFEIGYKDSLIIGMSIGYFTPLPQDSPCK